MHAVATCACAHVLSEQQSAMASVTLHRTIEQAMRVENEVCASRLCSADMQEALALAEKVATVPGERTNLKVTFRDDLTLAEAILRNGGAA